jgi:Zn-dependent membrane protease YugP
MAELLARAALEILERWPLPVAAALPFVLTSAVTLVYSFVHRAVRARRPDELPLGAGAWTRQLADQLGLDLEIGPTPVGSAGIDAFFPSARYVALKEGTFYRRDPATWAIGAHELGHALHARHPLWGPVLTWGRGLDVVLDRLLIGAWVAMLVVGGPWTGGVALALLAASTLAQVVVVVDEAWASAAGWSWLREPGGLTAAQLRRAAGALLAAWFAYVAGFFARIALLIAWPWLVSLTPDPLLPGSGLAWPAFLFLGALTLPLTKRAVRLLLQVFRPVQLHRLSDIGPHLIRENAGDVGGGIGSLVFVAFALLLPASAARDVTVALALAPALAPISAILASTLQIPLALLMLEVDRAGKKADLLAAGVVPEDHAPPARRLGSPKVTLALYNDDSWPRRLLDLGRIAYLPLVLVFWALIAGNLLSNPA